MPVILQMQLDRSFWVFVCCVLTRLGHSVVLVCAKRQRKRFWQCHQRYPPPPPPSPNDFRQNAEWPNGYDLCRLSSPFGVRPARSERHISQQPFDLDSSNFTRTTTPDMTTLANLSWNKLSKMPAPTDLASNFWRKRRITERYQGQSGSRICRILDGSLLPVGSTCNWILHKSALNGSSCQRVQ